MFCPQCGRELDLESGEIRFCRYCGFSLLDTKEALQGYSQQKRTSFSIVTWSYTLLLIVTLLLHGKYVSLDTRWVYWLLTILIVVSMSFFVSAAVSAMKPAMFSKRKSGEDTTPELQKDTARSLRSSETYDTSLLPPAHEPVSDLSNLRTRERVNEPRSVIEETTRSLKDRKNEASDNYLPKEGSK